MKKDKMYEYLVNVNNNEYKVILIERRVRYIRLQIKNNTIYFIARRRLTNDEVTYLVKKNEKTIIKFLNEKKLKFDRENEFVLFGKIYKYSDYTNKEIKNMQVDAIKKVEEMYYDIMNKYHFKKCDLYFRKMKSRWGVCYPTKLRIGLSTYLICVPENLINYVICHEFCHLVYANHSKLFYDELKKYVPDCIELRKQLKEYNSVL